MADELLVATRKGLFTFARGGRGGGGWSITQSAFLGDNVTLAVPHVEEGVRFAALNHGHFGAKLHRSRDAGKSWAECGAPAYPAPVEGEEPVLCPMRKVPVPNNLELIWSLAVGGTNSARVLWCGTVPGGLFRSTDDGDTWTLVRSLWDDRRRRKWFGGGLDWPGIHSICVDPRDHQRVLLGVSCGGVWETTDGGETWGTRAKGIRAEYTPPDSAYDEDIQDPHCLVMCPASPDTMWVQHHNGIFHTTNGGREWCEIKDVRPSTFGFPVAVHPRDPKTAWFVPAIKDEKRIPVNGKVVVTRTRDGGNRFETLDKGLPGEHAYDLTFRHALDVDESGDRLAFGSTTGSVWLSEDGGESWQTLSRHLPPVHSVRFVTHA
jgi:photosystem II stability/assembly factor-like uncharacterized protein